MATVRKGGPQDNSRRVHPGVALAQCCGGSLPAHAVATEADGPPDASKTTGTVVAVTPQPVGSGPSPDPTGTPNLVALGLPSRPINETYADK